MKLSNLDRHPAVCIAIWLAVVAMALITRYAAAQEFALDEPVCSAADAIDAREIQVSAASSGVAQMERAPSHAREVAGSSPVAGSGGRFAVWWCDSPRWMSEHYGRYDGPPLAKAEPRKAAEGRYEPRCHFVEARVAQVHQLNLDRTIGDVVGTIQVGRDTPSCFDWLVDGDNRYCSITSVPSEYGPDRYVLCSLDVAPEEGW